MTTPFPSAPDPCAIATAPFGPMIDVPLPDTLISNERVTTAGVLMLAHLYGTRLRFFAAVDRAREMLDGDQLCIDSTADLGLLTLLYCWPDRGHRVSPLQQAKLAARVLGIPHPDVPEDARDGAIQGMFANLLDAAQAVCDPGELRRKPTDAAVQRLESAVFVVRSRLSSSITALTAMQIRLLQDQLDSAFDILTQLTSQLPMPCRPGAAAADVWGSLTTIYGDRLRADGIDIATEAETARAWRTVFEWLDGYKGGVPSKTDICEAAAVLRPMGGCCGSCSEPAR